MSFHSASQVQVYNVHQCNILQDGSFSNVKLRRYGVFFSPGDCMSLCEC